MKKITLLLLVLLAAACKEERSHNEIKSDLFNTSFSNYKEIDFLKEYEKVTDTSFVQYGYDPTHRITQLKKDDKTLILFMKVTIDNLEMETDSILDTLHIENLQRDQLITIGYCEIENSLMEQIIAVVAKSKNETINEVSSAWKANAESNKIEPIEDTKNIFCLNEHYNAE